MVNLTRIYTRTGDDGTTSLGDFSRTSKNDPRLAAYADTNEANAQIGVALAAGGLGEEVAATLTRVQNELFDVGRGPVQPAPGLVRVSAAAGRRAVGGRPRGRLRPLPRAGRAAALVHPSRREPGAAYLHVATTIVRRAERSAWAAIAAHGDQPGTEKGVGGVNRLTATYLNRLSDLLFILARVANVERGGDVLWQPGGGRVEKPERTRRT